jgi:hypothetical protein
VDGRIILKLIVRKSVWRMWTGLIWLRIGTGDGVSFELLGFIKGGEFSD